MENGSFPVAKRYLVRMSDAMRHRGPDGAKVWYPMNLAMWWRHFIARQPIDLAPAAVRA